MVKKRALWLLRSLSLMALVVAVAGSAEAVQRMYKGEMRIGFGDGYKGPGPSPMGGVERVDTANNGVPPCAAPGAVVTPSGMNNKPLTSMGAGPATGTIQFWGLADVAVTAMGAIDPAGPIQLNQVAPTPAGFAHWGLVTSCPLYINEVPGGALFRRTQMATFNFPAVPGIVRAGGGAVKAPATGITATQFLAQRIGAQAGPNRFGGSVEILGNGNTILGFNPIAAFGLPSALGPLPIPLVIGVDGGVTSMGATIPTGTVMAVGNFKVVTNPTVQRLPGGPLPGTGAPNYPGGQGGAVGLGFRWTTGVISAYDNIGDFRTTRTRTGGVNFAPGPGPTSAAIQLVAPSVLRLNVGALVTTGIAVTSQLSVKFVPEPASAAMLAVGAGTIGILLARQRMRSARR